MLTPGPAAWARVLFYLLVPAGATARRRPPKGEAGASPPRLGRLAVSMCIGA